MIIITNTDDVQGSNNDNTNDNDDGNSNYDEGFNGGMTGVGIYGMTSKSIYNGKFIFILNQIERHG